MKKAETTETITFRLGKDVAECCRATAEAQGRTMNSLVNFILACKFGLKGDADFETVERRHGPGKLSPSFAQDVFGEQHKP